MSKLEQLILESRPVTFIFNIAKRIVFPGKTRLSLYELAAFFFKELGNNKVFENASSVTYYFVMAIPPTLLVLFSLVPYLPLDGVEETILSTLKLITPDESMYATLQEFITDFMNKEQTGVLSFGIVLTLIFSSNGIMGLISSFERQHLSVYVEQPWIIKRWKALRLTILLLIAAILSIAVLILQTQYVDGLLLKVFDNTLVIRLVSILVVVLIVYVFISIIYKFGPSLQKNVGFGSPGAIAATFLCIITSAVFFFMVNNFINYNKVYGSIGTLMAFMMWIWLNNVVLLICYDLNVSVLQIKKTKSEKSEEENI